MKKAINEYNLWVAEDMIAKTWASEDYENTTVYENINGDVIVIERDENGNIIDAWQE